MAFIQYSNIVIFAEEYIKLARRGSILNKNEFDKLMQTDEHVKLEYFNEREGKKVYIYLFAQNSRNFNNSSNFRRLINRLKNEPAYVITVTHEPPKNYALRVIQSFKYLKIKTYIHDNFTIIIPKGPLCYPHRILTPVEVNKLLNEELFCQLHNLPKISSNDPQIIWIGAEIGDVIAIESLSEISGISVQYRVVIPKSSRSISFREMAQEHAEDVASNVEDIADENASNAEENADDTEIDVEIDDKESDDEQ